MPACAQYVRSLRNDLHEWELRGCGGIRFMVEEDCFDVSVARDYVVVDRRRIEHWNLVRKRVQCPDRIGEERRRKWVEVGANGTTGLLVDRHCLLALLSVVLPHLFGYADP
jgi:hypothetical protein